MSSSINSFGSSELLPNPDDEPKSGHLSNSVPTTIESSLFMQKLASPSRPLSAAMSPPASNPVPIRASHHRVRGYSISAPSSANASPSGSLHGSPRPGSWIQRTRSSNSTCSYGSSWYGKRKMQKLFYFITMKLDYTLIRPRGKKLVEHYSRQRQFSGFACELKTSYFIPSTLLECGHCS